jgi:hypothetical protein
MHGWVQPRGGLQTLSFQPPCTTVDGKAVACSVGGASSIDYAGLFYFIFISTKEIHSYKPLLAYMQGHDGRCEIMQILEEKKRHAIRPLN